MGWVSLYYKWQFHGLYFNYSNSCVLDNLCGLVVRAPGYRSRGSGFDSLRSSGLSLVSTNEELFGRNSMGSGLENREFGRGDPPSRPRETFYRQKLALTSPTSGGRSVGMLSSRTKAIEFGFSLVIPTWIKIRGRSDSFTLDMCDTLKIPSRKKKDRTTNCA
jgi:hypothetical protein